MLRMLRGLLTRRVAVATAAVVAPVAVAQSNFVHSEAPAPALSPKEFRKFKLIKAEQLTADTKRYTFQLPREHDELGLTVASCLSLQIDVDGKPVSRPYTPTSPASQRGTFELIVKSYPEGKASKALNKLEEGAEVEFKGPWKKFEYEANQWKGVGMIAGGSGITPMYQLLQAILANPRDRTQVRLVYSSRTPHDIILKEELDKLASIYPNFKVLYTVSQPGDDWNRTGATGHVNAEMVRTVLPPPQPGSAGGKEPVDFKLLVCGPPGFMKHVSGDKKSPTDQGELTGLLKEIGYTQEQVFKY